MQASLEYGVRPPLVRRINFRMVVVVTVFAFLVGYPVWAFVRQQLNHGVERVGNVYHVDLKSLGYFPFDERNGTIENVPVQWRQLDGKQVALEGFMYNGTSSGGRVNTFQFVYNISKCCFSGPPQVQERVFAVVPNKADVDYYAQEVRITGILHVAVVRDESGKAASIYTMDVQNVEPMS